MTKKEFIKLFGEDPIDVLGSDWENDIIGMEVLKEVEYPITPEKPLPLQGEQGKGENLK